MNVFEVEDPEDTKEATIDDLAILDLNMVPNKFKGYMKRYPDKNIFYRGKITNHAFKWYLEICSQEELDRLKALKFSEAQQHMLLTKIQKGVIEVVKEEEFAITGMEEQEKPEFPDAKQISWKKDSIIVTDFYEGKEYITNYDHWGDCRDCGENRLLSGETGGACPICDKLVRKADYLSHFPEEQAKTFEILEPQEKKAIKEIMDTRESVVEGPKEAEVVFAYEGTTKEEKGTIAMPIVQVQPTQALATRPRRQLTLPEKKKMILETIELYKFMCKNVLEKSDYQAYKQGNKWRDFIKKSGCQKLAVAFNLTVEILYVRSEKEYNNKGELVDVHAYAKARAIAQNGSYIEATGDKSKSEYWSEKFQNFGSYNLHNMKQTAATRASNRAILNKVAFGEVSAEEINIKNQGKMFST